MPTSTKPRKPRAKQEGDNHQPGRIWTDLSALHQTCLSQVQSTAAVAPILKDPTFVENAVDLPRITELAKGIANKIPGYLDALKVIKGNGDTQRNEWDRLDGLRKAAWKEDDRDSAISYREQQDSVEFMTIQVGEQYQTWTQSWMNEVNIMTIELLNLIEQTRAAMEKKANAAE